MNPAEVKQALEIVEDAIELSGRELESYLDRVCGENSALRREVLGYLEYNGEQSVFPTGMDNGLAPQIEVAAASEARYDPGEEIARGGMGVVLRAFDNNIRRDVAIKVLRKEAEDNPDIVRRFLQEARIGGQLQHPGIPPVYEIGRLPDGRPFIAMKLVLGVTLAERLEQRQDIDDDQPRLLGIFEQICETMAFAHARGVIHRDLKPDNIMVGEFGEVQVMDWGIAKLSGDASPDHASRPTAASRACPSEEKEASLEPAKIETKKVALHTRVGQVLGTPSYMAPEQAIGRADKTTDVFALGGILCTILTGKPPYQASSSTIQLVQATQGAVRESHERLHKCSADRELIQLAIECLDPDISKRPADADHVKRRITAYLETAQERVRQAEMAEEKARAVAAAQKRASRFRLVAFSVGFALILASTFFYLRQQARHAEDVAKVQTVEREAAEDVSYWSTMLAAFREYHAGNNYEADRILARSPQRLRNWEWYYLHRSINSQFWEFEVPGRKIVFAIFVEGGTRIALIDQWSRTQIVDFGSGKLVKEFDGPEGIPLAVSADGNFALSVVAASDSRSRDRNAMAEACVLWETTTGKLVRTFATHSGQLNSYYDKSLHAAVSPTGSYIACPAPDDGNLVVVLYDTTSGSPLRTFRVEYGGCTFGPDGHWFIASTDQGIQIWDLAEDRAARPPFGHRGRILRCSPDRARVARVDHDSIRLWDIAAGRVVLAQSAKVRFPGESALFSEDGNEFITAFSEGAIHVWDSKTGELLRRVGVNGRVSGPLSQSSLHDNHLLVPSYDQNGTRIKLFDLKPDRHKVLRGHTGYIYPVAVSSDGRCVFSGSWDKTVKIWDGETGAELFTCSGHDSFLHDLDFDERSSQIVSVDFESTICLWDSLTGELKKTRQFPPVPERYVLGGRQITFTPDGKSIFGSSDALFFELDSATLEIKREFDLKRVFGTYDLVDLELSPSGEHVGIMLTYGSLARYTSKLKIFDTGTFQEVDSLAPGARLSDFAYSPDGSMIALGFYDGTVGLWNLADASEPIWRKQIHHGEVLALVFTPAGSRLFSGGRDATIRIWDTATGEDFGPLIGHENYVYSLDISDDGHRLVSGSGDGTARIWDAALPRKESRRIVESPSPRR